MKRNFVPAIIVFLLLSTTLFSFSPNKNSNLISDIVSKTNEFRRSEGLPKLILNEDLNAIAQKHSQDMAKGRVAFGHAGFSERNALASSEISHLHSFAENVAYGPTTAKGVVTLWKNSPGHRHNMLGHYKYIGIGIAKDRNGRIYYTEVFGG